MKQVTSFFIFFFFLNAAFAQFSMNGSAIKLADSTYQLTPKVSGKAGSIWDSTKIDISKSFDISFNLRFGCANSGGKGIAFVLQNDNAGLKALSPFADRMGYQTSILKSIAIEFDTYNDGTNDANFDHIAIHQNGSQSLQLEAPVPIYLDNKNVEDCGKHRVRVVYTVSATQLVVYVDCVQRLVATVDLEKDIFNGKKEVYLGFTASNGNAATTHLVEYFGTSPDLNFTLDLKPRCPDTLHLAAQMNRNEFTEYKWDVQYNGSTIYTGNTFQDYYRAPQLGTYRVTLEVLRVCDSIKIRKTANVQSINKIEVDYSYEIDTNCFDYKFKFNTSCDFCEDLRWDFGNQNATWGWPYQVLNLSKIQDYTGYFKAEARLGSCRAIDSTFFDLRILGNSAPKLWLSQNTICAGNELELIDSTKYADSVVFTFSPGFGLGRLVGKKQTLAPTGYGKLTIYRAVHYSRFGCIYQDSSVVQIDTFPTASFVVKDSLRDCNENIYRFTNTSKYSNDFVWSTSLGVFTSKNLNLKTTGSAQIKVELLARNSGCADTSSWKTKPKVTYTPKTSLTADTLQGCSPLKIKFNWKSDDIDSLFLDFGNNENASGKITSGNFTQTYKSGVYTVQYITFSGNGVCVDTTVFTNYITVEDSIIAEISFAQQGGCAPFFLNVSNQSNLGNAATKEYFLGVGQSSFPRPKQVYFLNDEDTVLNKEGFYKVVFIASNGFCADTVAYQVEVKSLTKKDEVDLLGVTVDTSQAIILSWNGMKVAQTYDIRRVDEAGAQRIFKAIADTFLLDKSVNTARSSYTYYVTGIDDCGGRTRESLPAKSILLQGVVNIDQIAELTWSAYEQFENGVNNYIVEPINGTQINTSGTLYFDSDFFDETQPDTGKCYRIRAVENGGDAYVSTSNILCLAPLPQVFFPTSFSPDGDGVNDVYTWKGVGIKKTEMRIFNRWGNQIYTGEGQWDGTFNNEVCEEELYFFVCTMLGANNETYFYSGQIYLIK